MLEIRLFEDKVQELFMTGLVQGSTHLCQGQEAVSVGAVAAMEPGDVLTNTYRGHGEALALGMEPEVAFAELMGRRTGCSRGLGGSMHLADGQAGNLGANAIVGAGLPIAVGAAAAFAVRGESRIALTFCGDGATNIGTFHESLNLAAVWRAPVVVVVVNNLYGEYSPLRTTTAIPDLAVRGAAYGIQGVIVDGQDVDAVHAATLSAVDLARGGGGPSLLEMKTYRYRGHSRSDPARYRPREELEAWLARDPIEILGHRLAEDETIDRAGQAALRDHVRAEMDQAAERAIGASVLSIEEAADLVYAS